MVDKFRGVHEHKDGGYIATIGRKYVGYFAEHADAVRARIDAEIAHIGKPYDVREIEVHEDFALIPMHGRNGVFYGFTKIDLNDLDLVRQISWTLNQNGYAVGRPAGSPSTVALHRFLLYGLEKAGATDHANGDKLDNRRGNLRKCTARENSRNTRLAKNNTSGFKGVRKTAHGMWNARIMVDRKNVHIGNYHTIEEATAAYDAAALIHHGKFASPNSSLDLQSA